MSTTMVFGFAAYTDWTKVTSVASMSMVFLSIPSLPSLDNAHTPHPAAQVGWPPTKTIATSEAFAAVAAAPPVLFGA